ncbi:MAG: flagellar basal body P-ring formation protein FlgA [Selenomonadaceae bacterium]|nr:flagellar basal body P-ring formation protein FlgA [Selenomonadaceae bacterium]
MKKLFFVVLIFLVGFLPKVSANQIIPGEQIQAMATDEVERILQERGEFRRHEIIFANNISKVSLPNGIIDIQILMPFSNLSYSSMNSMKARISIGGKAYRDVNFGVLVKVYDNVLVANHDLRIEVPVNESDFRMAEIVIDGRTEYVKDVNDVKGMVPHRYVRAGLPIAVNYFQQPVAVAMGTPVKIVFKRGGLQATAKGVALSRGRVGQIIKVKNETSQKIISARVVDDQTVEVVF